VVALLALAETNVDGFGVSEKVVEIARISW